MLKINESQVKEFDNLHHQKDIDKVSEFLRPKFESKFSDTIDEMTSFEQWFEQQLDLCQQWDIQKAKNIKSYCEYVLAYHPEFPNDKKFASLLKVLESSHDEDNKLDKINYRLLFFRS